MTTSAERAGDPIEQTIDVTDESTASKTFKSSVVIIPPEDCWDQIQAIRKVHDKGYDRWMPHINLLYPFLADVDDGKVFKEAACKLQQALHLLEPFRVRMSSESFYFFRHKKFCTLWLKPDVVTSDTVEQQPTGSGTMSSSTDDKSESNLNEISQNTEAITHAKATPTEGDITDRKVAQESALEGLSKKERKKLEKARRKQEAIAKELDALGESHPAILDLQRALEGEFPECNDVSNISERGFTPHMSLGQFSLKEVECFKETFQQDWQTIEFTVDKVSLISRADFHDPFHVRENVSLGTLQ